MHQLIALQRVLLVKKVAEEVILAYQEQNMYQKGKDLISLITTKRGILDT
jgi:hypothetical protein